MKHLWGGCESIVEPRLQLAEDVVLKDEAGEFLADVRVGICPACNRVMLVQVERVRVVRMAPIPAPVPMPEDTEKVAVVKPPAKKKATKRKKKPVKRGQNGKEK